MRLLEYNDDGEFSLTEDIVSGEIPKYAILSYTWGADIEEVTNRDLIDSTGKNKVRYEKIRFYGEQARHDGLQYFWVNTRCIDKSNKNELAEAINSTFRWYCDAAKCCFFLSDVPRADVDTTDHSHQLPWESAFRTSRWSTRGWTLQELVAPTSATEQMLWAETRQTTREEDMAHPLLAIFDGEEREHAFKRLRMEIQNSLTENEQILLDPQSQSYIQQAWE